MIKDLNWLIIPSIVALLIGFICPITGSLLVTQKRTIQANLIAHSVLPGLVFALAIGIEPTIGGLIAGVIGALLAERLNQRFIGRESGAMNTVLAGFTALGVLLVPLLNVRIDLESILFGDLLTANSNDIIRTFFATATLMILVILNYDDMVFLGVDYEGAIMSKRPVTRLRFAITIATSLVIISSITAVGVILVIGLICAPVLIHIENTTSLHSLMVYSSLTGIMISCSGILFALILDLPPGPLTGVLCVLLLFLKRP